ncbi:hypothetical protein LJC00_00165 [Dysgonomonas sp. OttesenSCG-928-M03]|nr:hypothetical protein [Dysgonomonas sp. OttesenSCG-928-M03]
MMIPVYPNYLYLVISLIVSIIPAASKGQVLPDIEKQIIFLNEDKELRFLLPDSVNLVYPVYENSDQLKKLLPVKYKASKRFPSQSLPDSLKLGCNYISLKKIPQDSVFQSYNILSEYKTVYQIVIKRHDGYLGYLEELLNVPFVLPPRRLPNRLHQTDIRLGVDCAELAIYGKRRQGYNIPYGGPRGIVKYLEKTKKAERGVIVHFRHQVSVIYEDNGSRGLLDKEDILIHAYKDKAELIRFGDTDLYGYPYTLYKWKSQCDTPSTPPK